MVIPVREPWHPAPATIGHLTLSGSVASCAPAGCHEAISMCSGPHYPPQALGASQGSVASLAPSLAGPVPAATRTGVQHDATAQNQAQDAIAIPAGGFMKGFQAAGQAQAEDLHVVRVHLARALHSGRDLALGGFGVPLHLHEIEKIFVDKSTPKWQDRCVGTKKIMKQYLDLLRNIMDTGNDRGDRTGTGTRSIFGPQFRCNLADGFPLLTTKKVWFKGVAIELIWFLQGNTNIKFLTDNGVHIWDAWADERGDLGPVYGRQWKCWEAVDWQDGQITRVHFIDQIANLVHDLRTNPISRRLIVSAWNPPDVPKMKLPPCHTLFQCYVREEVSGICPTTKLRFLDLHLYARSIDTFLGLPFNIASYALLLTMLARVTDMEPGELIISFGDLHIYKNHFDQVREQWSRVPGALPTLTIPKRERLEDYVYEDFTLDGYFPQAAIRAPIAV